METNTLYWGDNKDILREFREESVDLIYLDPPFNSDRDYNAIFKDATGASAPAQIKAFTDTWHWDMGVEAYQRGDHQPAQSEREQAAPGHALTGLWGSCGAGASPTGTAAAVASPTPATTASPGLRR